MATNPKTSSAKDGQPPRTRILNVAGVPFHVWQKARANALASDIPFRDYVIKLLENSEPVAPPNKGG